MTMYTYHAIVAHFYCENVDNLNMRLILILINNKYNNVVNDVKNNVQTDERKKNIKIDYNFIGFRCI